MAVTVGAGARTHGFLFADLRGYTAFVERNGDRAAARMLDTYRALVRAAVADHEGPEIRTEGDNVYVVFPSVGAAVACGLEIVRLAAESQAGGPDRAILVGVGVHAGETVETPEGFVGSAVNIAARVCAEAAAGEVLVTDTVRALTRTSLDARFEPRGAPLLKGVGEAIALFAVQAGSLVTPPSERGRRNPYKGLRPFEERDSGDFFGREALTARLVERLADVMRAGRLLAIVGPSGSGKSSVVRAGLLPALRAGAIAGSDGWAVATMSPGSRPFSELAAALKRTAGSRLPGLADDLERDGDITRAVERALPAEVEQIALVIDQAEELFTLVHEPALRNRFVEGLLAASTAPASRLLVILTIRADLLDRPLAWPGFGELLRAGLEVVTPMSRAELELAIARPAQAAGVELEPGLAAEMIADVASAAEALPLLQYALTVLFDQSDGRRLSRQGYTAIGGVVGALGRRAEETWASLRPECRAVARRVLLRLVAAGEGGGPIGRRVLRADLGAGVVASNPSAAPEGDGVARAPLPSERDAVLVEEVLDAFGRCRLLAFDRDATTGEPTVEVAHEAVLTRWPRLVGWIEQQREDIWVRRRLDDAAAEWARAGYDEGFLLTGSRLQLFAGWARSTDLGLSPPEQTFLDASVASRQRHDQAETSRSTHEHALERQSRGRLRWLVAVLAAFSLVAGSLLVVVFGEGRAAEEQASIARARELAAASVSVLHADPRLSLLLAVEAARVTAARGYVVEQAMDSLHWALQAAPAGYPLEDGPVAIRPGPAGAQGVYLLPPTQLIGLAQDRAGRSLTGSECATYLR
ncbi:MAG: nSTAND1 domain-containing NTPase, partial [Candidatus Limnocylindrales bacterium]